jgi:hypothetical protein
MRLWAKTLKKYIDVNNFTEGDEWTVRESEENTLYFRLVDLDNDGQRYISKATILTVEVTFPNIDDSSEFTVNATNPDTDDKSIFAITIPAASTPASGNFKVSVDEDGAVKQFVVLNGISVEFLSVGSC